MISICLFPYLTKSDSAQEVRQSANGKIYESILTKRRMEKNGSATATAASGNPFKPNSFPMLLARYIQEENVQQFWPLANGRL